MKHRRATTQAGVVLLVGIMSLLFIIPMVGLAIDVAVLYTVKAKLQSSVDGAALAAARALNLGSTTTAQTASAQQNAVNWFYANFPNGNWGTSNTHMATSNVSVFDDATNAHVRNVTVTADTTVATYFMRWFSANSVAVSASGNASRRDVVVMMVLDRSGSMNATSSCAPMRTAAKLFTGQFATGRDMIGLVAFDGGVSILSSPVTNFQTKLGYTNSSGSGAGLIDDITCSGGTGTAQAISVAYNELYKVHLPGALNVIMFESDGLPNTLTMNFWDSGTSTAGIASTSACTDKNGKTYANNGFRSTSSLPSWTPGQSLGSGSYYSNIPAGIIGTVGTQDPHSGTAFFVLANYWGIDGGYVGPTDAPGCGFNFNPNSTSDFAWFPLRDVWGNEVAPSTDPYQSINISGGHLTDRSWANFHAAALNATVDAAYNARTNPTIAAYFFGIGLGGSADPPDLILMQRLANDPRGDTFNNPAAYFPCATETGCVTYTNQPQGTFIYSTDAGDLGRAFLSISSQILRLSK